MSKLDLNFLLLRLIMKYDVFSALTIFILYTRFSCYFCALWEVEDWFYIWLLLDIITLQAWSSIWRYWVFILLWCAQVQAGDAMHFDFFMCYEVCSNVLHVLYLFSCYSIYCTSLSFRYIPLVNGIRTSIQ